MVSGITEIRALRESYGITVTELCKEMDMKNGLYSAHECGHRAYKPERYEHFYHEIAHALERITKRRKMQSYEITGGGNGSESNTSTLDTINLAGTEVEEDNEALIYQPLSDKLFKQAVQLIATGKNVVQVSILLEIDDVELKKKLAKQELENNLAIVDYSHEALIYQQLTETVFNKAVKLIATGKTMGDVMSLLEIDGAEFQAKMDAKEKKKAKNEAKASANANLAIA